MTEEIELRVLAAAEGDDEEDVRVLAVEEWARGDCCWRDDEYRLGQEGVRALVVRAWAVAAPGEAWLAGHRARGFEMLVHFDIDPAWPLAAMAGADGLHFEPAGADSFTVLHEVAHLITGGGGHHLGWRIAYQRLIDSLIGPDEGAVFAAYFLEELGDSYFAEYLGEDYFSDDADDDG